jgi:hypothetical protein
LIVVTDRFTSPGDAYEMELEKRVIEQGEKQQPESGEAPPAAAPAG